MKTARGISWFLLAALAIPFAPAVPQAEGVRQVMLDHGAQNPAVSPDGTQIAVSVLGKICIVPAAGGEARIITHGISWDTHPAWSADGQFLAYSHQLPFGSDLIVYNFATANSSILHHSDKDIGEIAYDYRGGAIYFVLLGGQYEAHLWRVPIEGGDPKQFTQTDGWHEWSFALSPDGKRAFLASGRYGGANLYLFDLEGLSAMRLTNTPLNQSSVAWSSDGKTLAYIETENGVDSIFVRPPETGESRRVFSSPYDDKELSLAPDGTSAVLCAGRKLYRVNLASGQIQPIPFHAQLSLPQQSRANLVIKNARLFDGTGEPPATNATIFIRDGRIAAVKAEVPADKIPANVPVIDAAGKTVLPGLMDNHYHYWNAFDGARLLTVGITSIRDPGSDLSISLNFKEAIALGLIPGPDIYTAGPLIDGLGGYHPMVDVEIDRPEAAGALVRSLKAQGVDLLKVYFLLKPDVLRAVVQAAHSVGLHVTGHIGVRTSWGQAVDSGIDGVNHIRVWADFLPLSEQPQGENENLDFSKNPIGRMQGDWREIDPESQRVQALIQKMARAKVGLDPTLSIQRIGDPMRRYLSLDQFAIARQSYQRMARFVFLAQQKGVPLLAGTDNGSLFDEMEAYAQAGIPATQVLRAATENGAEWLGKQEDFGSVQVGRRADLVFVDGDPLKEIKDARKISVVIKDGRIVFRK